MATLLSALETQVRYTLLEGSASFWTSAEVIAEFNNCIKDLWQSVVDLNQKHFETIDITNVSLAASATSLTGVPADVYKISLIEPRDMTTPGPVFMPKDYKHPDFASARALSAQGVSGTVVYYDIIAAGPPIAAPTVMVSPLLDTAVNLTLVYQATIATKTAADSNPIPGESDKALIAWAIAYLRAKERDDRSPDPAWIAVYSTLKRNLIVSLTPRQLQEVEYAEGMFEGEY